MFFLVRSISGPDLFLRTASPSSRYKPRSFVGMIFVSLFKINSPTSSHISAPSKDPIVTSNSESLFFIQASFSLNRSDFLECSIIWIASSSIWVNNLAKEMAADRSFSVIEG